MDTPRDQLHDHSPSEVRATTDDLCLGAVSGLCGGLIGAAAMTAFQELLERAGITSGVRGWPSTERAADRLARLTGRRLRSRNRPAAGEAVHYAVGSLVGGLYGTVAALDPRVTRGGGTAFGVVSAALVDETLVPAMRFGDPVTRAPLRSHPYSLVSHLVYGAFTESARRLFHRFFGQVCQGVAVVQAARAQGVPVPARKPPDSRRTLAMAFLLGSTAGPRTSAPLTVAAWAAHCGWIDVKDSPLAFLASTHAVAVTTPMAIGELIVDKLPATPDRTDPPGLAARAVSGAISGAALAGGRSWPAALAGAMGAVLSTYACYTLRDRVSKALGHDLPVAAVEDALAFGGAAMVCLASLGTEASTSSSPISSSTAETLTSPPSGADVTPPRDSSAPTP
ncbi:DUF4126 family protein [Mitsuaria sp. GD03876]|uniref:DUF4126 family protein n=1 Tax=Mitsuaria sp. GD03876 TaxID=2975399 RepID=UPI002447BB92|nr:DUF4126 family protein [Mitsuaria sp. GD03876]MDH0865838.1 DUF4126 family protein [Mitsuaria sp. GD03876]